MKYLLILGPILIAACSRTEDPTAAEGTPTAVSELSLQMPGRTIDPGVVSWWPGDGHANDIIGGNNGTPQNGATFGAGLASQSHS